MQKIRVIDDEELASTYLSRLIGSLKKVALNATDVLVNDDSMVNQD